MALVQRRNTSTRAKARDVEPEDDTDDEPPARPARRATKPTFKAPKARDEEPEDDGDDEDERPARRRASKASFKKGSSEGRRSRDEDDEDDEPRGKSDAVQSGWGAANKLKKEGGNFADEVSITKEPQLVKFLDDAPYAVYKQHWIDSGLRSTKKKSFICMGKGCPLCAIGENPAKKWAFNVALFEGDDVVEVKSLIAGSRLFDNIADEHEGADGPLDEGFWTLSKSGKQQSTTYKLKKLEGRKLAEYLEENDIDAEDEETLLELLEEADVTPYTAAQHQPPSRSYLQELADELVGADD